MAEHLTSQTDVQQISDGICVVTLPFQTLDQRFVDVFIEPRANDYFLINDGGKAVNELIMQGMKIAEATERHFAIFANRFGVAYTDEMFQTGSKLPDIARAVTAIGMCSTLAMTELLKSVPQAEEETIEAQIGTILRRWGRKRAKITDRVKVEGELKQHQFDFLVSPRKGAAPVAISVLNPTAGALSAAERFGFKIKDIAATPSTAKWKSVAVETKAEVWSNDARRIVEKCADVVIPISSGDRPEYQQISDALDRMVA